MSLTRYLVSYSFTYERPNDAISNALHVRYADCARSGREMGQFGEALCAATNLSSESARHLGILSCYREYESEIAINRLVSGPLLHLIANRMYVGAIACASFPEFSR